MSGVTKGLQLIADFLALLVRAFLHGNPEAIKDCIGVVQQWIAETTDGQGLVKINFLVLLLPGSDPWKGSRLKYREAEIKWKNQL